MNTLIASASAAISSLNSSSGNVANVSNLFNKTTGLVALVAGILAFIYLVYSGILYLSAAGNPDSAKKGQQGIINAIIGIIIIVAAWAIINAVSGSTSQTV